MTTELKFPHVWHGRQLVAAENVEFAKIVVTDDQVRMSSETYDLMHNTNAAWVNQRNCVEVGTYTLVTKDPMPNNVIGRMLSECLQVTASKDKSEVDELYAQVQHYQELLEEAKGALDMYYLAAGTK